MCAASARGEPRCSPHVMFKRMAGLEPATTGVESEVGHPGWSDLDTVLYHLSYILVLFAAFASSACLPCGLLRTPNL